MNEYQAELYCQLSKLVDERDAFYFQDFELGDRTYRIFNYRMASYTDFLEPGALECRGVMYEICGGDPFSAFYEVPLRMASLPMHKFFNLNENPMTMGLDLSQIEELTLKADGSLISSYIHHNGPEVELRLKSKGSIASEQALDALIWLQEDEHADLYNEIKSLTWQGFTVNMEWCSPNNRIVIGYNEPHLKVLNVRNMTNGEYVLPIVLFEKMKKHHVVYHWVDRINTDDNKMYVEHVVPTMTGIEGYVVLMKDGSWFKIKTDWYLALHRLKDSINSPRRLFEAILDEAQDDLRASFHDDPLALEQITEMEKFATGLYNEMVKTVEEYFEANKHLERKDYAIKGQQELKRMYFSLAMMKYTGREPDYKGFLKKQWKTLGLKDEVQHENDA